MDRTDTVMLCGGGSIGHVAPCLAVAEALHRASPMTKILLVGSSKGGEASFVRQAGYSFFPLFAVPFPRGLSVMLFLFPFAFSLSVFRAWTLLRQERPGVIISKGGYVAIPVCIAAYFRGIPLVLHESDSVRGMGTALTARLAKRICTGFPPEVLGVEGPRYVHTGNPVRSCILGGTKDGGRRITNFSGRRPVVMIIGGSQGAKSLNQAIASILGPLVDRADIIHLTGTGKGDALTGHARYFVREFVVDELPHLYALSDVVISRGGAGVLSELAALSKAVIVIPLEGVAHDHQRENAEVLAAHGAVEVLLQRDVTSLQDRVFSLAADVPRQGELGAALHAFFPSQSAQRVASVALDVLQGRV